MKTGSGDVVLGTVAGEISFSSGSGDLELVAGGRALVAKTGSGNVIVGTAPADVRVTTASGDIRIDAIDEGEVRVKAASGDIQAVGPRRRRRLARRAHRQRPGVERARHEGRAGAAASARCACSCRRSAATSTWRGSEPRPSADDAVSPARRLSL